MAQDTAGLIKALLNSGKISAETRADLEEFLSETKEGALDQSDSRYVQALAERILGTSEGFEDAEVGEVGEDDEDEWEALEERAETAEARVEELEAEVAALQERIDALEGELATLKGGGEEPV